MTTYIELAINDLLGSISEDETKALAEYLKLLESINTHVFLSKRSTDYINDKINNSDTLNLDYILNVVYTFRMFLDMELAANELSASYLMENIFNAYKSNASSSVFNDVQKDYVKMEDLNSETYAFYVCSYIIKLYAKYIAVRIVQNDIIN